LNNFKGITDWVRGVKEVTVVREYTFASTGKIHIHNSRGAIRVKGWSLPKIAMQAVIRTTTPTQWLFEVRAHENELWVNTLDAPALVLSVDFQFMVPHTSSLMINLKEGDVSLKKIASTIQVIAQNGNISIKNGMESIKAHASGPVFVQLDALQLHSTHDLLSTADGVTLSIPQSSHAQIQATTITQAIYCDHFITLTPRTMRLNKNTWQEMQRNIHALLGNGGALLKLSAYKGVHITY